MFEYDLEFPDRPDICGIVKNVQSPFISVEIRYTECITRRVKFNKNVGSFSRSLFFRAKGMRYARWISRSSFPSRPRIL